MNMISDEVWAYDCEWVPDLTAGRILYHLPDDAPEEEVLRVMWQNAGATPDNPQPFLRLAYCRIVSIAIVIRRVRKDQSVELSFVTLPDDPEQHEKREEKYILKRFLEDGIGKRNPFLVGFNQRNADQRILLQRALISGMSFPQFANRLQAKPWESQDIDLMERLAGFGKMQGVSLNDVASLSGIPGKMETKGEDVCGLWYRGEYKKILQYNLFDSLSTYLLWLRYEHFSGHLSTEEYAKERAIFRLKLEEEIQKKDGAFLRPYLEEMDRLQQRVEISSPK